MARMNNPRDGSLANVCTDVSTPERTKNVPNRESEKVKMANKTVQIFSASRFSITNAECNRAVPESQGRKFDPKSEFIRSFIPELADGAAANAYPPPIVDHREARERALAFFKTGQPSA